MASLRTYWKGQLRLSLVSIDVALHAATASKGRVSLRQIHEPTGKRIRYRKFPEGEDEPAEEEDIVKGYEARSGEYVKLEPEELEEIRLETRDTIRIDRFVKRGDVDPRYYERPYYLLPRGKSAAEGFVVIREALRKKKAVAIGQTVFAGREQLVSIRPCGDGMLLEKLRYAQEVRASDSVFDDIPDIDPEEDMMEMAEDLIEKKMGEFDPDDFEDSYETALRDLIEQKAEEEEIVSPVGEEGEEKTGEVVDLMEALKKSLEQEGGKKKAS